jgi:hypothetical protein
MNIPAASNIRPGDLRVSDADRDRAVSELSRHFEAGRLTTDELEERSGQALRARTGNDLATLFADLPSDQSYRTPAPADPAGVPPLARRRRPRAAVALAALAVIVVVSALTTGRSGYHIGAVLGPLLVAALVLRLLRVIVR